MFEKIKNLFKKKETNKISTNNNSFAIDVSKDINAYIKELNKSYKEVCNYPEILTIDENKRLEVLQFAWENWNYLHNNVLKKMCQKYPEIDESILSIIIAIEDSRLTNYCHMQKYLEIQNRFSVNFVTYYIADETFEKDLYIIKNNKKYKQFARLVKIEDMAKATNIFIKSNKQYCGYIYSTPLFDKNQFKYVKKIYLFKDSCYIEMTSNEFKNYCNENNLTYPF